MHFIVIIKYEISNIYDIVDNIYLYLTILIEYNYKLMNE